MRTNFGLITLQFFVHQLPQQFDTVFVGSRWAVVTGLILIGCIVVLVLFLRGTRNSSCTVHTELLWGPPSGYPVDRLWR